MGGGGVTQDVGSGIIEVKKCGKWDYRGEQMWEVGLSLGLAICLSYKYFLVVIFALRLHRRATLTRFNLGLNNTTPHAHAFPPSSCGLTRHRLAGHMTGYPQPPVTSLYFLSLMVSHRDNFLGLISTAKKLLLNSWIL